MSNPEIVRLQTELAWAQRDTELANTLLDAVLDEAALHHQENQESWLHISAAREREQHLAEEVQLITAMNFRLSDRLKAAGLLFDDDGPMNELKLVDAQIAALTQHRERLLRDQAALI